jgi:hypothetical protein
VTSRQPPRLGAPAGRVPLPLQPGNRRLADEVDRLVGGGYPAVPGRASRWTYCACRQTAARGDGWAPERPALLDDAARDADAAAEMTGVAALDDEVYRGSAVGLLRRSRPDPGVTAFPVWERKTCDEAPGC